MKMKRLFAQCTVEVEGCADEGEMGKSLREISEGFAMMTGFRHLIRYSITNGARITAQSFEQEEFHTR